MFHDAHLPTTELGEFSSRKFCFLLQTKQKVRKPKTSSFLEIHSLPWNCAAGWRPVTLIKIRKTRKIFQSWCFSKLRWFVKTEKFSFLFDFLYSDFFSRNFRRTNQQSSANSSWKEWRRFLSRRNRHRNHGILRLFSFVSKSKLIFSSQGENNVAQFVQLQSGQSLPCDMVIVAIGSETCTELYQNSPIEISQDNFIKVNERLETSVEHVLAVGDACKFPLRVFNLDHVNCQHWQTACATGHQAGSISFSHFPRS